MKDVQRAAQGRPLYGVLREPAIVGELVARLCEPEFGYCPEAAKAAVNTAALAAAGDGVIWTYVRSGQHAYAISQFATVTPGA